MSRDGKFKSSQFLIGVGLCLIGTLPLAAAAATGTFSQPTTPSAGVITFLAAYFTRRLAIGGWLLFFYMQLYASLAMTLVITVPYMGNLNPSKWVGADLYAWYVLSIIPILIALVAEVVLATLLLARRTERNLRNLRIAIAALLATKALSLAIDLKYFNFAGSASGAAVVRDGIVLLLQMVWLAYFYMSEGVKKVFIDRNWSNDADIYTHHNTA